MYMLISEPKGDEARRAFEALDEEYGVDQFTEVEAKETLTKCGFGPNMFSALVTSGCVGEAG